MIMQRAKLIKGLSDSEGQHEQLGQERQMGQEITGSLHAKENDVPDSTFTMVATSAMATRIFTLLFGKASAMVSWSRSKESSLSIDAQNRRRIPCELLSALVYCPPPRLSQLQFLADSMADSIRSHLYYCPPDLKLKRTVRTVRTVFHRIREESSVNRQRQEGQGLRAKQAAELIVTIMYWVLGISGRGIV